MYNLSHGPLRRQEVGQLLRHRPAHRRSEGEQPLRERYDRD